GQPGRAAGPVDPLRPRRRPAGRVPDHRPRLRREPAARDRPRTRAGTRVRPGAAAAEGGGGVTDWEAVIGLGIHVQLRTVTRMFGRCPNRYGDAPNPNVCAICLAHPGMLPVANREAVDQALRVGLALGCRIPKHSKWDRKNYFYPDSPKAYQISQYDEPLCAEGTFLAIGITRAHLEEDAAK